MSGTINRTFREVSFKLKYYLITNVLVGETDLVKEELLPVLAHDDSGDVYELETLSIIDHYLCLQNEQQGQYSLTIKNLTIHLQSLQCLFHLCGHLPNIEYLNVYCSYGDNDSHSYQSVMNSKTLSPHLKYFIFKGNNVVYNNLHLLIKQFHSSIKMLSLFVYCVQDTFMDNDMDYSFLSNLNELHLYFHCRQLAVRQNGEQQIIASKFQTRFWNKYTVMCSHSCNYDYTILTLPCPFEFVPYITDNFLNYHSNKSSMMTTITDDKNFVMSHVTKVDLAQDRHDRPMSLKCFELIRKLFPRLNTLKINYNLDTHRLPSLIVLTTVKKLYLNPFSECTSWNSFKSVLLMVPNVEILEISYKTLSLLINNYCCNDLDTEHIRKQLKTIIIMWYKEATTALDRLIRSMFPNAEIQFPTSA
ncbi:unnamed protein product [Didymodactylos carnosus]|uniref:Uncharacterized protein n=1 Tax=Didymodactylos carnosus TaxID=1234261 RepID=A0A815FYM9_9BILA|nr:unnamed protein product [Didymodactylos carnosus]CAF4185733.1 unnamed protein product [Didymodactylos carnosus]